MGPSVLENTGKGLPATCHNAAGLAAAFMIRYLPQWLNARCVLPAIE